ncbi:MAG: hypothetical protein A2283_22675 [Lentisphaerae bacterium RIFOXYA12_FULL_48_11]|nr:MAG: hypothetical protein A2283_22675 [Lentisphaerae bacterium RIFOXYA12_FULL_48_11]
MKCNGFFVTFCVYLLTGVSGRMAFCSTIEPPPEAFKDGVPVSIMKTLNEVEPRTVITNLPMIITNSGSYYLVNSLTGTNGIFIDTDDVTIDFGGFGISGDTNFPTHGIQIGLDVLNVTIKNGKIGDWGGWGIYSETNADFFLVQDLNIEITCQGGLKLGPKCRVERVTVAETGGDGIRLGEAATVLNCKSIDNAASGIRVGQASTVTSCTTSENMEDGIVATAYCTIRDCTSVNNQWSGIRVEASCRVLENNIGDNGKQTGGIGIRVIGPGNQIKNNNVTANNKGIFVDGQSNWLENNGVIDNNTGIEITGVGNFVIRNCVGTPLETNGIHLIIGPSNQVGSVMENMGSSFSNNNPWANIRLTEE